MDFNFRLMNQKEADEIAYNWKYDGIYSFYDETNDEDDLIELIDPNKRGNNFYSCYFDNELIGHYSIEIAKGNIGELGLGLKPCFTGKGIGLNYINAVMNHIFIRSGIKNISLIVAKFNNRAITVYKRAGFIVNKEFIQKTNGGEFEFLKMVKNS